MTALSWLALAIFAIIFLGGYVALRWAHEATPKRLAALYVAAIALPIALLFIKTAGDPGLTAASAIAAFWMLMPVAIILRASSVE